jgi:uncharacterized membrane protein YagU involved in acid resistance
MLIFKFVLSLLLGVLFAIQTRTPKLGSGLTWGLLYGVGLWVVGSLTFVPVFLQSQLGWTVSYARGTFYDLVGLMVFGSVLGLSLRMTRVKLSASYKALPRVLRHGILGAIAGIGAGVLFPAMFSGRGPTGTVDAVASVSVSVLLGLLYGVLFGRISLQYGSSLGSGMILGLFVWIIGPLTLLQQPSTSSLISVAAAFFPDLVGLILYGGAIGVIFHFLRNLWRSLFVAVPVLEREREGFGSRNLHAIGLGLLGSLAGGFVFSLVMVETNFLPVVASLVGSRSSSTGFIVHMLISAGVGATYGALFRRDSNSYGTSLGLGLVYGLYWWILGPLTLMPILLGAAPLWNVQNAVQAFSSLIGHFGYGAATALAYYYAKSRSNVSETLRQTLQHERGDLPPATWLILVFIAIILQLILSP